MKRLLAFACIASLALTGCGTKTKKASEQLVVFAAASLTDAFQKIDSTARFNFAGSDHLATQIREGAIADVFAAASPKYPKDLHAAGLVGLPVTFAKNRLVLIVPKANPAWIRTVRDLGRPGVKLVVGGAGVPIGDYTRTVLTALHASDVLRRVVSEESDVKGIVGKVTLGEADAGFVYATDVAAVQDKVRAIELPANAQPGVAYTIAVLTGARHADAARAFVDLLLGPEGRSALTAAGFGLP